MVHMSDIYQIQKKTKTAGKPVHLGEQCHQRARGENEGACPTYTAPKEMQRRRKDSKCGIFLSFYLLGQVF